MAQVSNYQAASRDEYTIQVTLTETKSKGDIFVQEDVVVVAKEDGVSTDVIECVVASGLRRFPKAGVAMTAGQVAFWDNGSSNVTTTAGTNKSLGIVAADAASGDTTVDVVVLPRVGADY